MKVQRKTKAQSDSHKTSVSAKVRGSAPKPRAKANRKHTLATYEHAPVGIIECSPTGKYLNVNEEYCRILDYERSELLQGSIKHFTHEEDYPIDIKLHEQLVAGQIPYYKLEKRYVRKDGSPIWVELTRSAVRNARGKALYTIGVVIDISERKNVESVLRESVERLRLATSAARMFTWELDLQKQIYTIADNFEQVLGFSGGLLPQNAIETVWQLSPAEDIQAISEAAAKAIAEHSDLHAVQYRVIDPATGEVVWLEVHAKVAYDERGNAQRLFGVAQNISENKKVQEQIRVISRMPEENPNPEMRLTPDGSVLYANASSRVLLDTWKQQTGQTIPHELKKQLAETFASGRKQEIEIAQNGKTFACTLAPIREAGCVNLYGNDITERKQIAQELAGERELLTRIFDAIPVMLTIYEPSSHLLRLNSQFEKTVGWSSHEATGVSLMEACYPDPEYRAQVGQFMELCAPDEWMDIRMQTRAGRTLETSWSNIRLSNDMQVGIGIDITERKRAENALRAKEAELQEIINRTPFMLTRCSRDLRYRFVSDAYARMIGRTPEEVAGKPIAEIMGEEGLKTIFPYVERVLAGDQVEYETEVPFAGVGTPSLHVIYTPDLDEHDQVIGWFASITDVTERKRSERVLAEFARQQEALYQLSDRLHHTDSLEDVYNASLDAILKGLQCDRTSILLFDDSGVMGFVAWRGLSEAYRRATEGHSPWRPAEENPYPVCIEDIPSSALSDSINAAVQAEGIGSLAFIPLISNGRLIGKFMIYFNEPHECSDIEIELGLMIGRQLAFGIERIKGEKALRASEARLQAELADSKQLQIISSQLIQEDNTSVLYGQIIDAAVALMRSDMASLQMLYPEKNELQLLAWKGFDPKAAAFWEWVTVDSHSSCGRAMSLGERVIVEDVEADDFIAGSEDLDFYRLSGIQAVQSTPLISRDGHLVGMISTHWRATHRPSEHELHLFDVLARQAADLIERKQAEETLHSRARQQEAVARLGELAVRERDLQTVFDHAAAMVTETLRIEFCKILELHDDKKSLLLRAGAGWRPGLVGSATVSAGLGSQAGYTLMSSTPVVVVDFREEQRFQAPLLLIEHGALSGMTCIIHGTSGSPWGVIGAHATRRTNFTEDDVNFLTAIANILGDAIQRQEAEEQLRRSEGRLQAMFAQAGVGVVLMESDCNMLQVNPKFCEIVGYSEDELLGHSCLQMTHVDDRAENIRVVDQLLGSTDETASLEKRYVRKDGSIVWVQLNIAKIKDAGGSMRQLVAVVEDVTKRKRAEEALRASEALYRGIARSIPGGGVYVVDQDFRYLVAEGAVTEAFGLAREDLEGRTLWEAFPDGRGERMKERLERTFAGEVVNFETEYQGRVYWTRQAPLLDSLGQAIIVTLDITERKQAEEALRIENERFMRFFNSNIVGILIGGADGSVTLANDYYLRLLGVTRQEFVEGKVDWKQFTPPEWAAADEQAIRELQERGVCEPYEKEYLRADGTRVPVYIADALLPGPAEEIAAFVLDITERKRAEEALRQSEERFARFMQHLPGLAWIKDIQGRYVYANAMAERAFSVSRENLYGRTDPEIFPAQVAEEFRKNDEQALLSEKGMQTVESLRQDDGLVHYSLVTKFPIPGPDGRPALIAGTAFDITERLQAEEALRESEERFKAILRQATAGIVRKDAEGHLIFVNEAFCEMLGYSEAELLGKQIWEFMHPDDIAENKQSFERLMQQGLPFKLERRFLRRDGSLIWVDASVSPLMDAAGRPQSAVAVEVDITGRKQAEEALQQLNLQLESRVQKRTATIQAINQSLREEIAERRRIEEALRTSEAVARESEEKLRTLFELLPVGISFLDPEGRVIQMNSALTHILKLTKEQILSQAYKSRQYVRANGTPMPHTEFAGERALRENRTVYNVETGITLENGELIWSSVSAAPVDVADVGVVVVTIDITEKKRAEQALQESHGRLRILSQRLVEVQEEERRALARELHDRVGQTLAALNINLIIINGMLSPEVAQQIGVRLNDSMKLVAESIALVRDVMTDLRPAVLDDYGLEAALEGHVNKFISRYNINAVFEKPAQPLPRLGSSLEMTFLRIAQEALINIAKHAHAEHVNLSLRQEAGSVCLTIRDNGIGIESWQEANRPGSHGLTIMRERAEAFGGTLQVKSVAGQGTVVEASIPIINRNEIQNTARKEQKL